MRTITAVFQDTGHQRVYIVRPGDNPSVGDMLITSYNSHQEVGRIKVATVTRLCGDPNKNTNPYLVLVKASTLLELREANYAIQCMAKSSLKRRKHPGSAREARAALDELLKESLVDPYAKYRALAITNPEAARLLAVLESCDKPKVYRPFYWWPGKGFKS